MISSTDFRTGLTIEIDGGAWQVVEFQHVKPGKGAAFVRTKIKNVETGAVIERTFNPNEKMPPAHLESRKMQYLYESDGQYTFMDTESFEQSELTKEIVKHRRGEDNRRQVAEEIADVGIMLEQLELMFNCMELTQDIREEKLARLKKRLEEN